MATKFKYNHETLDFDEVRHSLLDILRKGGVYLFACLLFFVVYYFVFSRFFSTPQEKELVELNEELNLNYDLIRKQCLQLDVVIEDLVKRDQSIYRRVFETDPPIITNLDDGTQAPLPLKWIGHESIGKVTNETKKGIDDLQEIVKKQTKRLSTITAAQTNNDLLRSLPSIQPVYNHDLRYIAATFGMRIHPFYKVLKMHSGIDFSVPYGSDVHVTASGVVEKVENNIRNAGLSITVDHGNGYKTAYHHLSQITVRTNQQVNRGAVIGVVGNSGRSVAPHLHYEIWRDGKLCNPIHYFFDDIGPENYQRLKIIAANKGQSLD